MTLLACNTFFKAAPSDLSNWNKLIKSKLLKGNAEQAILTYINMQELGIHADNYSFPVLLKACSSLRSYSVGLMLHGQTIKAGFCGHVFVQTALLEMYGSLRCIDEAYKVFDRMPQRDVVAWNAMLSAFSSCGQMDSAMILFNSMPSKDLSSFNIMISGFARMGSMHAARNVFDAIHCQLYSEVVALFDEMQAENCKPDYLTVTSVLSACAHLGSLETGARIHIYAKENGLSFSPHVVTALIDMYAKCGSIQHALEAFYKSQVKDIYCWNAIITGLALHGYGHAALKLFSLMRDDCIKVDDVTFISVLSACSHAGLVQEGCELFSCMKKDFGITPKLEHYGCMVDLLGRAGFLDCAMQLIEAMPFQPTESIWGALLSACVIHQDLETGVKIVKLISSRAQHLSDGELMMFVNLYAS